MHIIYVVKDHNTRELLLLEPSPTESSQVWGESLDKLRKRGVEQVDIIVSDSKLDFSEEVSKLYRSKNIQQCIGHLQRNLLNKVRPKDKSAFSSDLKEAFNNFSAESSKQKARAKIKSFVDNWKEAYERTYNNPIS
ncbi:MAG: transposase [Bacteroidota bacterium]